jgi:hypothetical protein
MRRLALPALMLLLAPPAARADGPVPLPAIEWAPRQYACCRAVEAPEIDGTLSDAAWAAAPWTEDFVDIEGPARPAPRFRTRAKMLWDDACLYVAAELEEPDVWGTLRERDSVIYHDNDFEVFIDPDGDTHEYYELEVNALGTEWDLLLMKPYRDGGPAVNAWDIAGLRTGARVEGTLNRPGDADAGWTVEIALPWAVLAECAHRDAPPTPGDEWRINFSRVEWRARPTADGRYEKLLDAATGKPLPENNWVWSPQGLIAMHYPEMWGIVRFSDAPAGVPRGAGEACDAAFEPDVRHAAAWSLRRVYYAERNWRAAHGAYTDDLAALGDDTWGALDSATVVTAGPDWFLATLALPGGSVLRIREDGRVW